MSCIPPELYLRLDALIDLPSQLVSLLGSYDTICSPKYGRYDNQFVIDASAFLFTRTHPIVAAGVVSWAWCASDICFKQTLPSAYFLAGRAFPVFRGSGLDQPVSLVLCCVASPIGADYEVVSYPYQAMLHASKFLREGQWFNVFP